jgi:DNA-binding PadR family transcriptional regulator
MDDAFEREIEYLRIGYLTYYILKTVESMPKVDMHPYYALISQEIENKNRLGAGKSLVYTRLKYLCENGFLASSPGVSSNPRAKKKVQFFSISEKGKRLLKQLSKEQIRISDSLTVYG